MLDLYHANDGFSMCSYRMSCVCAIVLGTYRANINKFIFSVFSFLEYPVNICFSPAGQPSLQKYFMPQIWHAPSALLRAMIRFRATSAEHQPAEISTSTVFQLLKNITRCSSRIIGMKSREQTIGEQNNAEFCSITSRYPVFYASKYLNKAPGAPFFVFQCRDSLLQSRSVKIINVCEVQSSWYPTFSVPQ